MTMKISSKLCLGILAILFFVPNFTNALELANFSIQSDLNRNVVLTWETSSEENNKHFEVEHSVNGESFAVVGKLLGENSPNISKNYQFVHQLVSGGKHFYRLKQTTVTGTISLSAVKEVAFKAPISREIFIAANPIKGDILQVNITGYEDHIDFFLLDEFGMPIYNERITKARHAVLIDMKAIKAGHYTYKLMSSKKILQKGAIELLD